MSRDTKRHIPAPGYAVGLRGTALCGRSAYYHTGDHEQIRRTATGAKLTGGDASAHYCTICLRRL